MARVFIHEKGEVFEVFETLTGHSYVRIEHPSEENFDDAILKQWMITAYRVDDTAQDQEKRWD